MTGETELSKLGPKKKGPGKVLDHVFTVRMTVTLHAKLAAAAEANTRTLTGEINHRLKQSFAKESNDAK